MHILIYFLKTLCSCLSPSSPACFWRLDHDQSAPVWAAALGGPSWDTCPLWGCDEWRDLILEQVAVKESQDKFLYLTYAVLWALPASVSLAPERNHALSCSEWPGCVSTLGFPARFVSFSFPSPCDDVFITSVKRVFVHVVKTSRKQESIFFIRSSEVKIIQWVL